MKTITNFKRILSAFLLLCVLLSCVGIKAYAASTVRDGEVVKQGILMKSTDGMVTVHETAAHTTGNDFDVTMTVTTSDLVELEPVKPVHIVLCIDRSNSMDGDRRTNTRAAVNEFFSGILDKDGIAAGNQVSVVSFGTKYWSHCWLTNDTAKVSEAVTTATTAVSDIYDGGTNVQAGIYAAQQVFAADKSSAQKVIVLFSDGMPTYSYRLTGTADWSGCTESGRRHNWNKSSGTASNLVTSFDRNSIVGSGSDFEYTQDNHYASLDVTCEHDERTTLTNKVYADNGQPAIVQAQAAKDSGFEIFTVFLDGYGKNEQTSKQNAEDTMKAVATDADHYLSTQDMNELSDLFKRIGNSIVTTTNAGTVVAPMGSYIQLGSVSELEAFGIAKTSDGLTWNVTAVTPTVDEEKGTRSYTVTYPITLQTDKEGFVEGKAYDVNPSAVLTYTFGGVEKTIAFDIPTVRGYLPYVEPVEVSYNIKHEYYTNGELDGSITVTQTAEEGTEIDSFTLDKITEYNDETYGYTSADPSVMIVSEGATMTLRYDRVVETPPTPPMPPVNINIVYTIRHEYYTNDVFDGATTIEEENASGYVVSEDAIVKVLNYQDSEYEYTGCTPSELTLDYGQENTIVLRYDRTVEVTPVEVNYTIKHEYYTNNELDGETVVESAGAEGTVLDADSVTRCTTYNEETYGFTSCTPTSVTLTVDGDNTIVVRYDRTVDVVPAMVPYTIRHEYYTNGEMDGVAVVAQSAEENTEVDSESIFKMTAYNKKAYSFTSATPAKMVIVDGAENVMVLRYDRTTDTEAPTKFTVVHEYYTDGKLDGQTEEILEADIGDIIEAAGITKNTTFKDGTYTFTSANYEVIVIAEGGENKIILRYNRPAEPENPGDDGKNEDDKPITKPEEKPEDKPDDKPDTKPENKPSSGHYYYDTTPSTPSPETVPHAPQTGDTSFGWLYVFAVAGVSIAALLVVPVIGRKKKDVE